MEPAVPESLIVNTIFPAPVFPSVAIVTSPAEIAKLAVVALSAKSTTSVA